MDNMIPSNIIIQGINFYSIINQLIIGGIDNYNVSFLFSAIHIHKKRTCVLCYNFTYNQGHW